jgi:hypothetical protein
MERIMPNKRIPSAIRENRIYIPLGKALAPVPAGELNGCKGCFNEGNICLRMACAGGEREDGRNVIFRLVGCPAPEFRIAKDKDGKQKA